MQLFCLLPCDTCGSVEEIDIPIPDGCVINADVVNKICQSELKDWGYNEETGEWMCNDCMHKPMIYRITDEALKRHEHLFAENMDQKTWAWEKLIKQGVADQLGIDSDAVKADEVDVKAYMDPSSMSTDFYISPVGMSWLDIKKRHPVKESKTQVP